MTKQARTPTKRQGPFSITVINDQGTPTTTQLFDGDATAAVECVRDYIRKGADQTQTWYRPIIAAYIFDSATKDLRQFQVEERGLTEL